LKENLDCRWSFLQVHFHNFRPWAFPQELHIRITELLPLNLSNSPLHCNPEKKKNAHSFSVVFFFFFSVVCVCDDCKEMAEDVLDEYGLANGEIIEIDDGLFLSNAQTARDLELLQTLAIKTVINLTKNHNNDLRTAYRARSIQFIRRWFSEHDLEQYSKVRAKIFDDLAPTSPTNRTLIHCLHARTRSPTVVVAYLMKRHGKTFEEAMEWLQSKTKRTPQIEVEFKNFLSFESSPVPSVLHTERPRRTASRRTAASEKEKEDS
jgi:hypothetical protein